MAERQHGFSLVEVIIVLVVLAITAGLVAARVRVDDGRDRLQATAYQLASRFRAARTQAIRLGSEQTVSLDVANRVVRAGHGGRPLPIPRPINIRTSTSATEQGGDATAGIRFYPDGSSTGGSIRLESGPVAYDVRVNWFTGRVIVQPVL